MTDKPAHPAYPAIPASFIPRLPRLGRPLRPGDPPIDPYGDGVGPFLYPKPVKEIVYRDFGLFFREVLARARKENAPEPPEEGPDPFRDPAGWIR